MTAVSQSKKPIHRRISPTFWTGETGKAIRARGSEAILVASFLMSSPSANMIGLYHQPVMFIGYYTALGVDGAAKGLRACEEVGFCAYDADAEMVWVYTMASWQIEEQLSLGDKRCKGVQREYDQVPNNRFLGAFFDRYAGAFHLTVRRAGTAEPEQPGLFHPNPDEAPSKPGTGTGTEAGPGTGPGPSGSKAPVGGASKSPRPARKCPDTFLVEADLKAWGRQNHGRVDLRTETAKFRDHTFRNAITDWAGAWRNWIRKADEQLGPVVSGSPAAAPAPRRDRSGARALAFGRTTNPAGAPPAQEVIDV